MFVGEFIKSLRAERGWSREILARESGLDPTTLRRCELIGRVTPRSAERLAAVFKRKPSEFAPKDRRVGKEK